MIVRQFLLWARGAPPEHRAEAVAGLVEAYLAGELSAADHRDAETALTAMLDDPSPVVRRALADALADSADAPRHLVIALANDQGPVAEVVLARSPVLLDGDLIDCAALGDEPAQTAIARRPYVSVATAAALAEIAGPNALAALAANPGADIADASLWRLVERHGSHAALRQALLRRASLPLDLRHAVGLTAADGLSASISTSTGLPPGRVDRAIGDVRDRATVALAAAAPPADVQRLAAYLRRTGQLTPALILRALLSRSTVFVEAAFAELALLPPARVAGLLYDRRGSGLPALLDRAGLPASLKPAFSAAVAVWRDSPPGDMPAGAAQLSRRLVERVIAACAELRPDHADKLMALLRRYEAEAAREAARDTMGAFADASQRPLEHTPVALITYAGKSLQDAA
jgi:uncharacterized protein (DUF2336 family)